MKNLKSNQKSQVTFEFLMLIGIVFLFFGITSYAIIDLAETIRYRAESEMLKDLGLRLKQEINLASNSQEGYSRTFEIPDKINGEDYNISIEGSFLILRTKNRAYYTRIENFTGFFNKTSNRIKKENGLVYLNVD
jgi:hypothetical protein